MTASDRTEKDCILCRPLVADAEFDRIPVWEDGLWRLTTSLSAEVPGFSYLEPKKHVAHITDLQGELAASFGIVLARCTRALKEITQADVVYVYIFGDGIPHFHVHLAPHRKNDALSDKIIRGDMIEKKLPSGATWFSSKQFPPLPRGQLRDFAERIRQRLGDAATAG